MNPTTINYSVSLIWPRDVRDRDAGTRSPTGPRPRSTEAVDSIAEAEFAKDSLGSLTIGVVSGRSLTWSKSFGHADSARTQRATPTTVYRVASIKPVRLHFDGALRSGTILRCHRIAECGGRTDGRWSACDSCVPQTAIDNEVRLAPFELFLPQSPIGSRKAAVLDKARRTSANPEYAANQCHGNFDGTVHGKYTPPLGNTE